MRRVIALALLLLVLPATPTSAFVPNIIMHDADGGGGAQCGPLNGNWNTLQSACGNWNNRLESFTANLLVQHCVALYTGEGYTGSRFIEYGPDQGHLIDPSPFWDNNIESVRFGNTNGGGCSA